MHAIRLPGKFESEMPAQPVAYLHAEATQENVQAAAAGMRNDRVPVGEIRPERLRNASRHGFRISFTQSLREFRASKPFGHFGLL